MVITSTNAVNSLDFIIFFPAVLQEDNKWDSEGEINNVSPFVYKVSRNYIDAHAFVSIEKLPDSSEVKTLVNYTDEELIGLIKKNDHNAFTELVRRHSTKFYSTAYRILMNKSDSEDMVQDAFLKLWNEPDLWDKSYKTKFTTWFYRVIINQCLDYKRKRSYRNHDEYTEATSSQYDTDDIIESKSKSELINNCIKELPERQQIALNLYYYENLSMDEAAEIMELKRKGMESLVMRAKENLKDRLRGYHEQEAI